MKSTMKQDNDINIHPRLWFHDPVPSSGNEPFGMLNMVDTVASLFSIGPFYYYLVDADSSQLMYVSNGITSVLGLMPHEFTPERLQQIIHPEDKALIDEKAALADHFYTRVIPTVDIPHYKSSHLIRLQHSNGRYKTILHQTKLLNHHHKRSPQCIHIHTDISYLKVRQDHKISFIGEHRPNYHFDVAHEECKEVSDSLETIFTKKELHILKLLAQGKTSQHIAEELFMSILTVNTHKRNILSKTHHKNMPHLVAYCVKEGII